MPRRRRAGVPLWRHLGGDEPVTLPLPKIQIFGGGAHAGRRVDIQDFLVVCPAAPLRRGDGVDGRGLSCGRRDHGGAGQLAGRRRRGRLVARVRRERGGLETLVARRSSARASAPATRWHRARRRGLAVRPRRPLPTRPATGASSKPRNDRTTAGLARRAIRSSRSRIRWPRTIRRASSPSPAQVRRALPGHRRRLPGLRRGPRASGRITRTASSVRMSARLGHEVDAAEDDVFDALLVGGLAGELEAVAGEVGEVDDGVLLVVVAEDRPGACRGASRADSMRRRSSASESSRVDLRERLLPD